jgi:3-hydroxyisobutyrate dehydrogenase
MTKIAFLGLGSMGRRMTARLAAAGGMLAGAFAPAFPIDLVVKDFGLATGTGADLPVTGAVGAVFQQAALAGWADDNITAVARRYGLPLVPAT